MGRTESARFKHSEDFGHRTVLPRGKGLGSSAEEVLVALKWSWTPRVCHTAFGSVA